VDGSAPIGWTRPGPDRSGLVRDACVGGVVAIVIAGAHWTIVASGILSAAEDPIVGQPVWLRVIAPLAFGLVVALRRVLPVTALLAGTAVFFGFLALGYLELFVTPYVYFYILYSAGAWSSRRALVTVLRILIAVGVVVASMVHLATLNAGAAQSLNLDDPGLFAVWASLITVLFYVGAIWLGNSEYLRAGQRTTMDAQVAQLRASRAQLADQAVRLDRLRIARELHDSVAHHVSLMGVQAAVARRTLEVGAPVEAAPPSVVAALENVETSARDAVNELHSVLVTLRSDDEGAASPALDDLDWHGDAVSVPSTWTLAQVPVLLDQARISGTVVHYRETGRRDPLLKGTVELTVYRVLQEALTNVRKHAGAGAAVAVHLRHHRGWLDLDVTDDGVGVGEDRHVGVADPGVRGGRGILGMGERAKAVGGVLRAGPGDGGGFRVRLRVPARGGERLDESALEGLEPGRSVPVACAGPGAAETTAGPSVMGQGADRER
jgi:signal transduction histidine kinase